MKAITTIITLLTITACGADPDHPGQTYSGTGIHPTPDRQGLAAPRGEGGAEGEEAPASTRQAVIGCEQPIPYMRTVTAPVVLSTPNNASCPQVWYHSTDPFQWRIGHQENTPAPVVPSGPCQWVQPAFWSGCTYTQRFVCPNGIDYLATTRATNNNLNGDPWAKGYVEVTAREPGCQRLLRATFNVTGP